jgi:cytochrome c-type biogenesis protein CcmH
LRQAGRALALVLALGTAAAAATEIDVPASPDLAAVQAAVGPPRGGRLEGPALEAGTTRVTSLLRCPVCQGLSVADSPAGMAQNMKRQVRELLATGYDEEQILTYFELSYGEFVRLEPPLRGVNWLVWLAPLVGLLVGGGIVAWALRAPRGDRPQPADEAPRDRTAEDDDRIPGPDTLPEDAALAEQVLKVRELAYGWPGGLSPEARDRR